MQTAASGGNPQTKAALLLIVGCVVAVVGTLLDWWTVTSPVEEKTEAGTAYSAGTITLFLAIVIAVLTIIMWFRAPTTGGRGLAIAAFVLGLIALLAAAYSAFAPEDAVQQFESSSVAEQLGISDTQAEAVIETAIDTGQLEVEAAIGTYVATAGAALLVIGALLGMAAGKRAKAALVGPPPVQVSAPPAGSPPGSAGPGAPMGTGTSTPADPTGSTAPPPGSPGGAPPPTH